MSAAPPTITQLKDRFISRQVLQLSTPVTTSAAFRSVNERADKPLEPRLVEAAVTAVDTAVQEHYRRIFVPQASRAVSEQISDGYTKEVERKLQRERNDEEGLGKELDLSDGDVIESLPDTWGLEKDVNDQPAEAKRYSEAIETLNRLNEQRKEVRLRVERLRRLQAVVDPLQTQENGAGVQENLATRNGALEKELEKMRMLLVRVAGRVESLDEGGRRNNVKKEIDPPVERRKRTIDEFLSDPTVFPGNT